MPIESVGKIELSSESKQARIIQLSGEGKSQQAIAREVGVNRHTVRNWQERWCVGKQEGSANDVQVNIWVDQVFHIVTLAAAALSVAALH